MKLLIKGGKVYDPSSGVDGAVRDLAIEGGKVVALRKDFEPDRAIDAAGCAVMPGGVDIHCHIAGSSVNRARRLLSSDAPPVARRAGFRSGSGGLVPSTFVTGYRYSVLGYTTALEAAIDPSGARQCHLELKDTPNLDCAFLLLLSNHALLLDLIQKGEKNAARDVIASLLRRTGALGIKAVNPGGVALWKSTGGRVEGLDQALGGGKISPRAILETLANAAETLDLPHPLHIHANRLGLPGNVQTTLETSRALEGRRHHFAHLQFHVYGADSSGQLASAAPLFAEHMNKHPEVTADVGQVTFGEALTLSADLPLEHLLWQLTGKRYVNIDFELESGCGMVPFEYRRSSSLHSLQWAAGMELFLLCRDPWRLALSTDHPNGGSFLAYPKIIAFLMQKDLRDEAMRSASKDTVARTVLRDIAREYTLAEIAIITRAGPARMLGLRDKGHLAPGADADVTIYDDIPDREAMFRSPRYVLKGGAIVVEKGELRAPAGGERVRVRLPSSSEGDAELRRWFERHGSYRLEQLGPGEAELAAMRTVSRERR